LRVAVVMVFKEILLVVRLGAALLGAGLIQ
jgi:hypothetical protein